MLPTWLGAPLVVPAPSTSSRPVGDGREHKRVYSIGARNHTKLVRVTLDGTRESHDASRHLVGGGPTYERIIENLSRPIPSPIEIRMNVHKGNHAEMEALKVELDRIAKATGNRFNFRPSEVFDNTEAHERSDAPDLLDLDALRMVSLTRVRMGLHGARGTHCPAQNPYDICIDNEGGLHACQATLSVPELAFGDAWTWDPARYEETATRPGSSGGSSTTAWRSTTPNAAHARGFPCAWAAAPSSAPRATATACPGRTTRRSSCSCSTGAWARSYARCSAARSTCIPRSTTARTLRSRRSYVAIRCWCTREADGRRASSADAWDLARFL